MKPTTIDLSTCDREPIHIPGSIQSHGALLACDGDLTTVQRESANAPRLLGTERDALVGEGLERLFGERGLHNLRNALARAADPAQPALLMGFRLPGNDGVFDVSVHRYKGAAIIELEPGAEEGSVGGHFEISRALISRIKTFSGVEAILEKTPRLIRGLLGYDRVMIYQFLHDGSGKVVSEARRNDLESFLGQHFPASDIPAQARELYIKNTIRIIGNVDCERVPINPVLDASGEPLDLSFAHLRSVSPIHCEYLRNMGVGASMSISIVIGGQFWGLIACHHYSPRVLNMAQRIGAEQFGAFFSLHLESALHKQRLEQTSESRRALDGLLRGIAYHDDAATFLRENLASITQLLPCDGVGVWLDGTWAGVGSLPPKSAIPPLARYAASVAGSRVWATHELSAQFAQAAPYEEVAAGCLVVPLSQVPRDYLFFFRKEVVQTIEWAGNPNKTYNVGPLGDRLTPRQSFAIWKETVERQSQPWTAADREIGEALRTALLEVILRQTEILASERRKSDLRQKVLNEELNHRVKNILALIRSVVSQPSSGARSLEEYVATLRGRIMALAHAHDQVVRNDGGGSLGDLLSTELLPYRVGTSEIVLEGPDVGLDARAYSVMALVFHELATNAAKYGALSRGGGCLAVTWTLRDDGACEVQWVESGGPPVVPPKRQGFGSILVGRSVPFDLGGESQIAFEPEGVAARFLVPNRFVTKLAPPPASRPAKATAASAAAAAVGTLSGRRVLVVEDQLVIALDVETMLADNGAEIVETASSAAEALRLIGAKTPDLAVLDVNLGVGTSMPVADELIRREVPFVFATGYGDTIMISPSLREIPVVRKPYDEQTLLACLLEVLGQEPKAQG